MKILLDENFPLPLYEVRALGDVLAVAADDRGGGDDAHLLDY